MRPPALSTLRNHALGAAILLLGARASADTGDEIVVAGARKQLREGPRDDTAASSVVGEDALARAGGTVAEGLRTQPGLVVQSSGSSADLTTVLVRGATSAQLPVYVAGVRINDEMTGVADLSTVPAWILSRAEIYRGNAPLDADRGGIAGALFLEPRAPRGPLVGALGALGSYGYRSIAALGGTGDERAGVLVAIRREDADNDYPYLHDAGTRFVSGDDRTVRRPNGDSHATDVWAIGRLSLGESRWSTVLSGFSREQGVPGLGLTPAAAARARTTRALAGVRGVIPCGLGCEAVVGLSALRSSSELADPRGEIGLGSSRLAQEGRRLEPSGRLSFDVLPELRLLAAADLARESIATSLPASRTEAMRTFTRGALEAQTSPAPLLRVSLRGSVERSATTSTDAPATEIAPLGVRLSQRLGDDRLALLANLSQATRAPTLGELYGQSAAVRGNPALAPERAVSFDLGARAGAPFSLFGRASRAEADVFVFTRSVSDLVAFRRASVGYVRPYNVGAASVRGVEGAASTTLAARVVFRESLTMEDARDISPHRAETNDILPFRPRLVSASRAALVLGDLLRLRTAEVGADLVHQASRYADPAGLEVIPAQTTLDLDAQASFEAAGAVWTLRGRIANLTDVALFDLVGYPLPPRRAFVSLEATY